MSLPAGGIDPQVLPKKPLSKSSSFFFPFAVTSSNSE